MLARDSTISICAHCGSRRSDAPKMFDPIADDQSDFSARPEAHHVAQMMQFGAPVIRATPPAIASASSKNLGEAFGARFIVPSAAPPTPCRYACGRNVIPERRPRPRRRPHV